MELKFLIVVTIFVTINSKFAACVPTGDIDDERDVNFLINKIKEVITKDSSPVSPSPRLGETSTSDNALKTSNEENVIRFDSKGDSIESEKAKAPGAGGCRDKIKSSSKERTQIFTKHVEANAGIQKIKDAHHDKSSSVDDHAIRYDRHGNSFEEYKDSDERHNDDHKESSEEKPKRKKKTKANTAINDGEDTLNLNSILNDKFVNKQLDMRELHDDDSDDMEEDDDIPLITIPMYDILRQYQRMQQGFISETEEYSDETTQDVFADPHLKNILKEISAERKAFKNVKIDGQKVKPAAKRVFERHFGPSDESL